MLDNLCLCSVWPILPKPYGNSQGSIDGNNCGFPYIDSGVSACPIASIFSSLVKCCSAITLMVLMVFPENSSPVSPWTINGQGLSVVPSSSSISCILVDSEFLFELDG